MLRGSLHGTDPGLSVLQQPAAATAGLDDASPPRMIHGLPRNGASPIGALGRPYGGANGAWPGYTAGQVRLAAATGHSRWSTHAHAHATQARAAGMPSVCRWAVVMLAWKLLHAPQRLVYAVKQPNRAICSLLRIGEEGPYKLAHAILQGNGVALGQQRRPQLPHQHVQQQHQQGQAPPPQPSQPSAKPAAH